MDGDIRNNIPFAGTSSEVAVLIDGVAEGLQAAHEAKQVHEQWESMMQAKDRGALLNENARKRAMERVPNPATGVDESTQIYNLQTHVAAMPPQAAQVVVQAAPSGEPNQTITIHMNNEIKGAIYDSRAFKDLSDYLVDRLKEQFDRRGVRYSNNW